MELTDAAPGQEILANTPAGLVVTDGVDGTPYLAEISDAGELTRTGDLPEHDSLVVSPGAQRLDGTDPVTFNAPSGWTFRVQAWAWEDDDHLVSPVVSDDPSVGDRLVRCSAPAGRCVLIKSP